MPVYNEEDRIQRQLINEVIQDRVAKLQPHRELWNQPVQSNEELCKLLWPFYEELAVTDITHSIAYRQAMAAPSSDPAKQQEDFEGLTRRFNDLCLADRTKTKRTELLVLEHRLCLEEEKFLYTKLKNDYYANYANMGGGGGPSGKPR